jgi:hypothetical protein
MTRNSSSRSSKAASLNQNTKPLCKNLPLPAPQLSPDVMADPSRARAIIEMRWQWLNGTVLHYCFFREGSHFAVPKAQADAIRGAFDKWKAVGIGLEFQEVDQLSAAEVRIGYSTADRESSSHVGRDLLRIPLNEPTTRYGWDLTTPDGSGTALHEIGHVLGMMHEHQNPRTGIKWHDEAVYDAYAKPPNSWDRGTIYHNILEKLTPQQVQGSKWDPDSIMEYDFPAGLIDEPEPYDVNGLHPPGTLSSADKQWALNWYPELKAPLPSLQPFQSVAAELASGQQVDFAIKPTSSRKYRIETKGATDTLLALFEEIDGEPRYLSGDDDSGEDRNASITYKLFQGRSYIVRLRIYYPGQSGKTSLMIL